MVLAVSGPAFLERLLLTLGPSAHVSSPKAARELATAAAAREREARPLPELMVIDFGDRGSEAILQLCLRRFDVFPLALQRLSLREVQFDAQNADVARAHVRALIG